MIHYLEVCQSFKNIRNNIKYSENNARECPVEVCVEFLRALITAMDRLDF